MPATDPASYPIGTVIVHPDDDRNSQTARRRVAVDDSTHAGPYKGCRWERLTGVGIHDGGCDPVHSDAVVGWPVQPLAELAVVLVHEQDAEIQRLQRTNESLLAMLERMETLHITWRGPGGEEFHPDWCRECRVDKVRAGLGDLERQRDAWWNQRAAGAAEVRASREAWAIEADRLDVIATAARYYVQPDTCDGSDCDHDDEVCVHMDELYATADDAGAARQVPWLEAERERLLTIAARYAELSLAVADALHVSASTSSDDLIAMLDLPLYAGSDTTEGGAAR